MTSKSKSKADPAAILARAIDPKLARDFLRHYEQLRRDVLTKSFERTSGGKLVETFLRILQSLSGGVEPKLDVEAYFRKLESGAVHIDEGLRICGGRIARAIYAVRSKRSIAHTGDVEPNEADLRFSFAGAQWLLAELLRVCGGLSMREAALLVNASVGNAVGIVDETSSKVLLLADVSVTDEIVLRLHHDYPATVALSDVLDSLDRRKPETVKRLLRKLWTDKLVEGSPDAGYRLTDKGLRAAAAILERVGGS